MPETHWEGFCAPTAYFALRIRQEMFTCKRPIERAPSHLPPGRALDRRLGETPAGWNPQPLLRLRGIQILSFLPS